MIESVINTKNPMEADVVLLSAGYDRTASLLKGAAKGPAAIVKCLHQDIEFFDRHTQTQPHRLCKIAHHDIGRLNNLKPDAMVRRVAADYRRFFGKSFVILLGGEHSVSIGAFSTISQVADARDITIVCIDAHLDCRNDDGGSNPHETSPSQFAHCCVTRRACEMGFSVVIVGARSFAEDERDYARANGVTVFEWGLSRPPTLTKILKTIRTRQIYLSIDTDGIDPAHTPAVGCPVPGGLDWAFTLSLCRQLFERHDVVAADIVEVAPRKGEVLTQFAIAQLTHAMIAKQLAGRALSRPNPKQTSGRDGARSSTTIRIL